MSDPGQVRDLQLRDIGEAVAFDARPSARGRHVVAVIGIDQYARWPRLRNAVSDARAVEQRFHELGFETITPSLFDGQATRTAIEDWLEALRHGLAKADHLVVYFAGHGGLSTEWAGTSEITTGYLIPVDGERIDERLSSLLELDNFLARVAKLAALHIVVILDACYAGMALSSSMMLRRPRGDGSHHPHARLHAKTSRVVIASTLHDEQAQDAGPLPGHSLFTGLLLHALAGDMVRIDLGEGRRGVHGSSLGAFMRDHIHRYQLGARQTPDFGRFGNDDRGDMPIVLEHGEGLRTAPRGSAPRLAEGSAPVSRAGKQEVVLADEPAFTSRLDVALLAASTRDDPPSQEPALTEILPMSRARPIALAILALLGTFAALAVLAGLGAIAGFRLRSPRPVAAELGSSDSAPGVFASDRVTHADAPPPPPARGEPRPLSVLRTAWPLAASVRSAAAIARCPVDVRSSPKGADILRGSQKLGVTPMHLELPCGKEVSLSFHKAEYNPTIKQLVPTPEGTEISTRLSRTTPRSAAPPDGVPAP